MDRIASRACGSNHEEGEDMSDLAIEARIQRRVLAGTLLLRQNVLKESFVTTRSETTESHSSVVYQRLLVRMHEQEWRI
jgi:hypothetical protein